MADHLVDILNGLILVLAGVIMYNFPSKSVNRWYGYRTPRSMRSAESWTFSQRYSSIHMMIWGFVGFIINLIYYTQFQTEKEEGDFIFGIATLIGAAILVMIFTERALIRKFPKNTPDKG